MRSNLAAIASVMGLTFLVFPARAQESTKTANIEDLLKMSNMSHCPSRSTVRFAR
jgi:hypothetical protein